MKGYYLHFLRVRRRAGVFLVLFFLIFTISSALGGTEAMASDPITNHLTGWPYMTDINESSAVLMDADTGAILYSLDRNEQRYPASITKIMTCLLAIEQGDLSETITITEAGLKEAYLGSSNIVPILGEQFTLEQCLYMLMLKSANDIATELAVHFGGSVEGFTEMMNARAAEMGCTGTHFHNANGLPDTEHYTTAYDMALIMKNCIQNETFRRILGTSVYTVQPTNMTPTERIYQNHCKLIIKDNSFYYENCIGGKTGYTDSAWRTLVTAAEKDGMTLVCVTMHGPDTTDFVDHASLFDYGFNNFRHVSLDGNSGEGVTTGTVTLPNSVSLSDLEVSEVQEGEGTIRYYTYEGNPVGKASVEARMAIGPVTGSDGGTTGDRTGLTSETSGASGNETIDSRTGRTILFALIFIVVILAAICLAGLVHGQNSRSRRRRRRRRSSAQAARRRAESYEGGERRQSYTSSSRSYQESGRRTSGRRNSSEGRRRSRDRNDYDARPRSEDRDLYERRRPMESRSARRPERAYASRRRRSLERMGG